MGDGSEQVTDAIGHRGPAGRKHWIDAELGVAIGQVFGGVVPSASNGFSSPVLREEDGIVAAFDGDASALVSAWRSRPDPFASQIEDAFALGLWDGRKQQLCLVRDALATKPLYHSTTTGMTQRVSSYSRLSSRGSSRIQPFAHTSIPTG